MASNGKIDKPKLPFVIPTDASFVKNKPIVEDHRLNNWQRWLKRRERQYRVLEESGSQSKTEMVMNSCEKIRPQMEMKSLMEYATSFASSVSDKNRGNPGFWKLPPFLPSRGNFCSSEVGPVLTKRELNILPTLEYVDVPMCIRKEKNLLNPLEKDPAWKRSSYLNKRKYELAETIAILQPSIPETANLIARGQGLSHEEEYVTHLPVISVMDVSLENEDSEDKIRESPVSTDIVVTLKINDVEITRDEQSIYAPLDDASEQITWTLNFSSPTNQRSQRFLHFENKGTVAITYQWRNAISTGELRPLSSRNHASFFFNKSKSLILPGQKVHLPVWFQERRVGIFSESWRIETDPKVSRAAFIIRMSGYAALEDIHTSKLEVDVYLDRCIRNTTVRETIDDIIHNGRPSGPPEPAYKNLYLEGELFRAKNPSYSYHATLVTQLYRLYGTASVPDASSWTLSLVDLRHVLLEIKDPVLRHERLKVFSDLCRECLGHCLFNPVRNTKYAMVYNVLCAAFDRMEEEGDFIKRNSVLRDAESSMQMETRIRSSHNSSLGIVDMKPLSTATNRAEFAYLREVFYVRTYELLVEAVDQACAVIDSLNNLNEFEL